MVLLWSLALMACEKQSVMERAADTRDEAGSDVADTVEDASKEVDD